MPAKKSFDQAVSSAAGPLSGASGVTELLQNVLPQTVGSLNETLTEVSRNFSALAAANQSQAEAILSNTQAVTQNTAEKSTGGVADTFGKIASSLLGGLESSVSPVISGLLSLFGSGQAQAPAPLPAISLPSSINFAAANAPGSNIATLPSVDYGQSGAPRAVSMAPQITIQVQAMDSRSFLDHSADIAQAVREAMLNMHSLNDVVSDL